MLILAALSASLFLVSLLFARRTRGLQSRMMRPAEDWSPDEGDQWLDLIEPFPLPEPEEAAWPF